MPLKGVSRVRGKYMALVNEISGPRTIRVVNAIIATGAAYAKLYTPVDTSTMLNSQHKKVDVIGSMVIGVVGYYNGFTKSGFSYQLYLETHDNWSPRKKKTAKPHFLQSGFEDPEPQSDIKDIIMNGYKL